MLTEKRKTTRQTKNIEADYFEMFESSGWLEFWNIYYLSSKDVGC
jgi:hypothetical protein